MPLLKSKPIPEVVPTGVLRHLKVEDVKPSPTNPRRLFDRPELDRLKKSVSEKGVLVPIIVYQPKGQSKFSILDGERRFRCVLELSHEGVHRDIPANVVEPPSKIAGLLYMFSIHNFRQSWELMPTALSLKIVMDDVGESDTATLSKLTGLKEAQIERCKKLLAYDEKYQVLSLDPDPKTRIPSNFWIELLPVLDLVKSGIPTLWKDLGRDRIIEKLLDKYRAKRIRSVIHFRRIMEGYALNENDQFRRSLLLGALEEFILNPNTETRAAFDEFVTDKKRARTAVGICEDFTNQLQSLKLSYTTEDSDREKLHEALEKVEAYCKALSEALSGTDSPETSRE
jgi:ParB family transcriptional regulator, chromosome partitioning protein